MGNFLSGLTKEQVMSAARSLLKVVGGATGWAGYVGNDEWTALTGAIAVIAGFAFSVLAHKKG